MKPIIIIPAYQPGKELLTLVEALSKDPEQALIVVDDGSSSTARDIFGQIEKYQPQVEVLHHAVNLGKGQALKTAFNHFLLKHSDDCPGVITADADGQHAVGDILRVSQALQARPYSLCMGSRVFDKQVPFRRRFGNKLTRVIFTVLTGVTISDAQTGLRGIPTDFLRNLLRSPDSGYDFELDMLIRAAKSGLRIFELPIQTIYMENNTGSHFNYIKDSLKIYFVFLRFSMLSLATAAIDYIVFALQFRHTHNILSSIILARLIAGTAQFAFGKFWVFRSSRKIFGELTKYVILVGCLMLLSYGLITSLVVFLRINPYLAKALAEGTIFLLSFAAQNILVYTPSAAQSEQEQKTNWDAYYEAPFKTAYLSRRFTENKLHRLIDQFAPGAVNSICELGGGNSHFFPRFRQKYPQASYTIVDSNRYSLEKFSKGHASDRNVFLLDEDVINPQCDFPPADVVFSIGLIEHFSQKDTARAIRTHFSCSKPDSIVIITFPTPTWLYSFARRATELLGGWRFPDERPLSVDEVTGEAAKYGKIVHQSITWPVLFTQGVVVVRADNPAGQ